MGEVREDSPERRPSLLENPRVVLQMRASGPGSIGSQVVAQGPGLGPKCCGWEGVYKKLLETQATRTAGEDRQAELAGFPASSLLTDVAN